MKVLGWTSSYIRSGSCVKYMTYTLLQDCTEAGDNEGLSQAGGTVASRSVQWQWQAEGWEDVYWYSCCQRSSHRSRFVVENKFRCYPLGTLTLFVDLKERLGANWDCLENIFLKQVCVCVLASPTKRSANALTSHHSSALSAPDA